METGSIKGFVEIFKGIQPLKPKTAQGRVSLLAEQDQGLEDIIDQFMMLPSVSQVAHAFNHYKITLQHNWAQMDFSPVEVADKKGDLLHVGAGVLLTGGAFFLLSPAAAVVVGGAFLLSGCEAEPEPTWDSWFQRPAIDIEDLMDSLTIPGKNSEAFQEPTPENLEDFYDLITDILQGGFPDEALLHSLNYEMINVSFKDQQVVALVHQENFGGTYLINLSATSKTVLEVPHPVYEEYTLDQSAHYFKQTKAKALLIAGTHRCANEEYSPCAGKTLTCGGPKFRISDVAHYPNNYFQKTHEAFFDNWEQSIALQLHGFDSVAGDAIISNGKSTNFGAAILPNQLAIAVESELSEHEDVNSCNRNGDPDNLCGTTNVQGRYSNGSTNICKASASSASNRFIHLEQRSWLATSKNWHYLLNAIKLTLAD